MYVAAGHVRGVAEMVSGASPNGRLERRLLVATDRRATEVFLESVARSRPGWTLSRVPVSPDALDDAPDAGTAVAALVDFGPDPSRSTAMCRALQSRYPRVPVVA